MSILRQSIFYFLKAEPLGSPTLHPVKSFLESFSKYNLIIFQAVFCSLRAKNFASLSFMYIKDKKVNLWATWIL